MRRPPGDTKPARSFVIVSRQALVDSNYSTVVCAPVFTERHGLPTQVNVGADEGLKHDCAIHCDGLMSLEKSRLTDYVGELSETKKELSPVAEAYHQNALIRAGYRAGLATQ